MTEPLVPPDITDAQIIGHVSAEDIMRWHAEADAYRACALALLGNTEVVDQLRGQARIGLDTDPQEFVDDEDAAQMHDTIMRTLERLDVEPLTSEEMVIRMQAATMMLRSGSVPTA